MQHKVCIELHTDNKYIIPTIVTITSLLCNKKQSSNYEIRVLGNNLTDENIQLLQRLDISVIPHECSFAHLVKKHDYVSKTDLFKFDLPDVLFDWDKVIYIDTDMIIQDDLTELFNIDLGDNYVAAVKDMYIMYIQKYHNNVGLENYFNAGMMVLNLKKMREDNIKQKLIEFKLNEDSGIFVSQDALNIVFKNKIKWLPPIYNYMITTMDKYIYNEICDFFNISYNYYRKLKCNSSIVHFAGGIKPWESYDCFGHRLWKKYFDKSIVKNYNLTLIKKPLSKKISLFVSRNLKNLKKILLYKINSNKKEKTCTF